MNVLSTTAAVAALALLGSAAFAQQPTAADENTSPAGSSAAHPNMPMPMQHDKMPMPMPNTSTSTTIEATLDTAPSATSVATPVSVTTTVVASAPIPDTPENRAKYGQPMSNAGKRTAASGN